MAVLLAQPHKVVGLDIVPAKVDMINKRQSPIYDAEVAIKSKTTSEPIFPAPTFTP